MNDDDERLKKIERSVERIEQCVIGDPEIGQLGLVSRTNNHAKRIAALERVGVYIAGAGGLLALIWSVWTQWPRK